MAKFKRYIFWPLMLAALLLKAHFVFAEMEFPPNLDSEEKMAAFMMKLRREIPETIDGGVQGSNYKLADSALRAMLRAEQELIHNLRNDHEYMARARQRPPLQTFQFERVLIAQTHGRAMNAEWSAFLRENNFDANADSAAVENELVELFERWPSRSANAFFSGLAQFVKNRELLSEPDLAVRWQEIRRILDEHDLQQIRQKFKASIYGVENQEWTLTDLDGVVDQIVQLENRILVLMEERHAIGTAADGNNDADLEKASWIIENRAPDDLLLSPKIEKLLAGLKNRAERLFIDPSATIEEITPMRQLVLRELPPYLAIYRGCVGSDCSTTHSWAFPYSPLERDWWIDDTDGNHLGYVSGNVTMVGGQPSLYIRDVTGGGLGEGDIELILDGFSAIRQSYGANLMTIMSSDFTAQNHFGAQMRDLKAYPVDGVVNQSFLDESIRNRLLSPLVSSSHYDAIGNHQSVRLVKPRPQQPNLRIYRLSGPPRVIDPKKDARGLWQLLIAAVNANNPLYLQELAIPEDGKRRLVDALRNIRRQSVARYYEQVKATFEELDLPFSQNLVKKYESLFFVGHMSALDAFSEQNLRQTIRFTIDVVWRSKDITQASEWISSHLKIFEENDLMTRAVRGLFERKQQVDAERMSFLWNIGYRFTQQAFSQEDLKWISIVGPPDMAFWAIDQLGESVDWKAAKLDASVASVLAKHLDNEDENIDESISERAAERIAKMKGVNKAFPDVKAEIEKSIFEDDNLKIQFPLALAYLRDHGHSEPDVGAEAYAILSSHRDDRTLARNWRNMAKEVLSDLPRSKTEQFQAAIAAMNDGDCDAQLAVVRRPRNRR